MKKISLIVVSVVIGGLLTLSSCKKDEEATPDNNSTTTNTTTETTTVTNYLLSGTWEPTHSDTYICDNKNDVYTFTSATDTKLVCSSSLDLDFKYSMSADGEVFKFENIASSNLDEYTVTEFTETTLKASRKSDGVKFYLKKK